MENKDVKELGPYSMLLDVPVIARREVEPVPPLREWYMFGHQGIGITMIFKKLTDDAWYIEGIRDINGALIPITPNMLRTVAATMEHYDNHGI